jgi:hypothetical protein
MPDTKGILADAEDGLKIIFGRLAEFFHIFDLSFIVSGAASFGALAFLSQRAKIEFHFPFASWVAGFAIVIACYISGLLSFAFGRLINGSLYRRRVLEKVLWNAIDMHELKVPENLKIKDNKDKKDKIWRLYIRLWQQFSAFRASTVVYSHLSRYWAMAATFDGLAVSLLLWASAILISGHAGAPVLPQTGAWVAVAAILGLAAILSFRQGAKYLEFQVEDIVAALAVVQEQKNAT